MIVELFGWLVVKHFVVDFLLQTKYQYSNKGKLGHPGGLLHSLLHGCATFSLFSSVTALPLEVSFYLAAVDSVVHYFVDLSKVKITAFFKLACDKHEEFWWLLGFDQLLHYLTYVALVAYVS